VLEYPDKYAFISMLGKEFKIIEMEVADKLDLARLRIDDADVTALNISSNNPSIDDPIVVYGNSTGSMTIGKLKGKVMSVGPDIIEISATIVQGNSGSPIVDKNDKIVGVATYAEKKKPDWVTANTRFSEVRRYGVRLNNDITWNKTALDAFTHQAVLLNDINRYLYDLTYVMPKMKTNVETPKKTNGRSNEAGKKRVVNGVIECPDSESLYTDKTWFKLIKDACAAHNKFIDAASGQSQGTMHDPESLKVAEGNNFKHALNDIYNIPLKKLKDNEWISNYYKDKSRVLQEYVSSLSNAVYKVKAYYKLE
jgi:V8-like Glu-specific endopeptidase